MHRQFKIVTLGCPKNLVDSEQIKGLLIKAGFIPVDNRDDAEVIIVNTCGFIESAKQESIDTILALANYKNEGKCAYLVMSGCMVQKYAAELAEALPEVDLFIGPGDLPELPHLLAELESTEKKIVVSEPEKFLYDDSIARDFSTIRPYAYVKIAEGCNNCCTYCVIPQLKGAYRSRKIASIIREVNDLVAHGVKEVILVAQDTTSYGIDLAGESLLPELLRELCKIRELAWIRLLYCYPDFITDELLLTIKREEKICKYLDIPLQHIADPVLKAMGRAMSKQTIYSLLQGIRTEIPEVILRSTFIVGFPGETKECYNELLAFLQDVKFDRAGFFAYSQEPGTVAAILPGQISNSEKNRRVEKATKIQERIHAEKNASLVQQKLTVIVDGASTEYEGLWEGRTRGDAPEIDGLVFFKPTATLHPGDIVTVKVTHSEKYSLIGEIWNESGQ
ncbi:MAG: 30S ribosomal protein S12 methylthiotransferase RimO [Peptococcia bacterium]|jgi:ribosomal protein S12 methylthiotransferase